MKDQYRKFKIKTVEGQSDVDCLEEVIRRRFNHPEWPMPSMLLIDGGRPQVNRVEKVLQDLHILIPIVGIAKGPERKKNEFTFPVSFFADDEKIAKELGMEADEVLRLVQVTGLAAMFADREFSEAWEADTLEEVEGAEQLDAS